MKFLPILLCFATAGLSWATDLVCCGGEEVFLIDPANPGLKKWTWKASDSPSIPQDWHRKFRSTDDCKPYEDGAVLITSSSSGVALVDMNTKKCLFLAESRNAHSACLLPGGQVAVAASHGGDAMHFYDLGSRELVQAIYLTGAHGAVWDGGRQCLWGLGTFDLLRIEQEDGKWAVACRSRLPSRGGHDLSTSYNPCGELLVTSNTEVFLFNKDTGKFRLHEVLGPERVVKSVDQHPASHRVVWHQAAKGGWWSDTIRFVGGEDLVLEGERLYKVRWNVPLARP